MSQGLVAALLVAVFVLLAREAAHRVVVVLGAVATLWLITYFTPFHLLSFESTREALDIILKMWSEPGGFDYKGKFWHVTKTGTMFGTLHVSRDSG